MSGERNLEHHIGERIRQRRAELGLTQEQLASNLDVSYQQVQKYETGANRVSASRLHGLAHRMGVPVQYFFDGFDNTPQPDSERSLAHGGRQRVAIDLVRGFAAINNNDVKLAVSGLVRAVVDRQAGEPAKG